MYFSAAQNIRCMRPSRTSLMSSAEGRDRWMVGRYLSARYIMEMGTNAKLAVPGLRNLLKASDAEFRDLATNVLLKIDPGALESN